MEHNFSYYAPSGTEPEDVTVKWKSHTKYNRGDGGGGEYRQRQDENALYILEILHFNTVFLDCYKHWK